jgi:hypothetical protein
MSDIDTSLISQPKNNIWNGPGILKIEITICNGITFKAKDRYLISQKWLEKNAEKTIKIVSEVIIMRYRYVQL